MGRSALRLGHTQEFGLSVLKSPPSDCQLPLSILEGWVSLFPQHQPVGGASLDTCVTSKAAGEKYWCLMGSGDFPYRFAMGKDDCATGSSAVMLGAPKHMLEQELLLLCNAVWFVLQLNAQRSPLLRLPPPHPHCI